MPITTFQRSVLLLLKKQRNPDSYVAGGTAIQRSPDSLRYSNDIDFFHDTDEAVTNAYQKDRETLLKEGYSFDAIITQPSFYRAIIERGQDSLKLEWVRDTAFRFFPVVEDKDLGYRLHDADLAINKCLALANRSEIRDLLDIIEIDSKTLPLGACVWAACGKDPGFTPALLFDMIQRHAIVTPDMLATESLAKPIDAKLLKSNFLEIFKRAKQLIESLAPDDLGCLYLDEKGAVIQNLNQKTLRSSLRHFGSVKGSWPRLC